MRTDKTVTVLGINGHIGQHAAQAFAAAGWQVAEVEVNYLPRIGKSKVTGTVRGCVRTVHDMSAVLAR